MTTPFKSRSDSRAERGRVDRVQMAVEQLAHIVEIGLRVAGRRVVIDEDGDPLADDLRGRRALDEAIARRGGADLERPLGADHRWHGRHRRGDPLARVLGLVRPPRQVPLARPEPVVKRLGRGRRVIEPRHPGPADRGRGPGPALELVGGRGARVALGPLRRSERRTGAPPPTRPSPGAARRRSGWRPGWCTPPPPARWDSHSGSPGELEDWARFHRRRPRVSPRRGGSSGPGHESRWDTPDRREGDGRMTSKIRNHKGF